MSEHLAPQHHNGEHAEHKSELHTTPEKHEVKQKHEQHEKHESEPRLDVEKLQKAARESAVGVEEYSHKEQDATSEPEQIGLQREVKAQAYQTSLRKIRTHLKPRERTFSKVVHQPLVESLSELGGKSVARPSGLLGGGLLALLGSGLLLYMSKHYGFRYNFFVFILFLVGGFAIGIAIEAIVRLTRRPRTNS